MFGEGHVCLEPRNVLPIRGRFAQHPGVTLSQAKDGEVCEEAWQQSGLVVYRVLFWCNEPCGHMSKCRQPPGCIMPSRSKACWEKHLGP